MMEKCVITRDLGYMKFGPVWTNLFVHRCVGLVSRFIFYLQKNIEKADQGFEKITTTYKSFFILLGGGGGGGVGFLSYNTKFYTTFV